MHTEPHGAGGALPRPRIVLPARRGRVRRLAAGALLASLLAIGTGTQASMLDGLGKRVGQASWYGWEFASRPTASGERFDPRKLTGAHRTLPFGTRVRVTNLHNGRSVLITITDRGPALPHREIDLSYGAARALGMVERGVARVSIEPVEL
jgi:rare lipoprotein A (peptidoglycan hydrolase)